MSERPPREEALPASDEVTEVAPNIVRMQLPIEMPGLGHVNCYGLLDDRGLAIVDPGWPDEDSYNALGDRLKAAGYELGHVHTVIITHSHLDHFGGAAAVRDDVGADIVTHESFRTFLDLLAEGEHDHDLEARVDRIRRPGTNAYPRPWVKPPPAPDEKQQTQWSRWRSNAGRFMVAPDPSIRLVDGDHIELGGRSWTAMHTPGHTPDHLCLVSPDDGVMLCGDHVLPTITPHLSGLSVTEDPLDQFLDSLRRVGDLDGISLVLPAHGHPFTDLQGRTDHIIEHHSHRLESLRQIAIETGEASVVELSRRAFRERSWGPMAESETYAHLEHLRLAGEMKSRRIDGDLHYVMVE